MFKIIHDIFNSRIMIAYQNLSVFTMQYAPAAKFVGAKTANYTYTFFSG